MASLFVISEIGESKEYSTYDQLSKLYSGYLSQIGITNGETYLISGTGDKVSFESFSKQNINNNTKSTIFVYSQVNHYELFQQFLVDDIISKRFAINFTSASNLLSEGILSEKLLNSIETLINDISPFESSYDTIINNSSIEATYNQIINTYMSYNNVSMGVSSSINQISKMKENIINMQKGSKLLLIHFNSFISQLSVIKKSIEEKESDVNARIKQSDISYRNFLEVKSQELQKSLSYTQNEMFELYFNESKARDTKAKFVKKYLYIQAKIKEKNQMLRDQVEKITKANIGSESKASQKDIDLINKEFDQLTIDKAKYKKHKIYDDLILFQNKCQTVLNEYKINQSKIISAKSKLSLNDIKDLKDKYDTLYPLPVIFEQAEEKASQFKDILKRIIMKNCQYTTDILNSIKVLSMIHTKYKSYEQCLSLIETDINEFDSFTQGAKQYNNYCDEIKARLLFNQNIDRTISELKDSINYENKRRRKFNKLNGDGIENMLIRKNISSIHLDKNSSKDFKDELILSIDFINDTHKYPQLSSCFDSNYENNSKIRQSNELRHSHNGFQQIIKNKEKQVKQMSAKIRAKDEQIIHYQNELEKISKTIESLTEGFLDQVKELNKQIQEKETQLGNLSKIINDNTYGTFIDCPMCKDAAMNSVDYQMWSGFVKELNEKLNKKSKDFSNLQLKYNEMVNHLFILKKSFFNHLNKTLSQKNQEIYNEREYFENALLHLEDLLSNQLNKENNQKKTKSDIFKLTKGSLGIFVNHSNGVYIPINSNDDFNRNQFSEFKYILDNDRFDNEMKELMSVNSLVIIGRIGNISQDKSNKGNDKPNKDTTHYIWLDEVYYVLGLKENEKMIRNYSNQFSLNNTYYGQEDSFLIINS